MSKYWVVWGCAWALGCAANPAAAPAAAEPPSATPEVPESPAAGESAKPSAPKSSAAKQASPSLAAAPPKRERIRLHNSCSKPVPLRIERDHDSDTDTTLGSNTSTEERATDGDEIRLMDDRHNIVSALKIEPSTQEINVTSDCSKLEAK